MAKTYAVPDGQSLSLSSECFRCAEALFRPSLVGVDSPGIDELACESIRLCDRELQPLLCQRVVLTGNSTKFDGFAERVRTHVTAQMPQMAVNVHAPPERGLAPWLGGAAMANSSSMPSMWITRREYDECGVDIVHRKCSL